MSEVAREIRRLRKEKDWTQTELAVYAGSSQPTINQIESGTRNPSTRTLEKIAGALGVEVGDLFPKLEAPLPFEEPERRAQVEKLASRIGRVARKVAREVERMIPDHDSRDPYYGEAVYVWSSALNREYRLLKERRDELKPSPGNETVMLDGALARLWQALEAGRKRAEARGEAWDDALEDLRTERAERPAVR